MSNFAKAILTLTISAALVTGADAQPSLNLLSDLAQIKDGVRSKRVSSFDRSGGNNDRFENIADGERRVVADIQGAGIINHIWITIAPPPPDLSRNDIILRMYWDGSEKPCVESPIGPFSGRGGMRAITTHLSH